MDEGQVHRQMRSADEFSQVEMELAEFPTVVPSGDLDNAGVGGGP
jgi:hypothetical protein